MDMVNKYNHDNVLFIKSILLEKTKSIPIDHNDGQVKKKLLFL